LRHCIKVMMGCVSSSKEGEVQSLYGDEVMMGYLTLGCYLCLNAYVYWGYYYR